MGRIYEAFIVQTLLAVIVLGMAFVLCALVDKSQSAVELFFDVWNYLPFLYSCLSFLGVVLLLLCTPLGFARLFTVLGQVIVKPNFLSDVNDEYYAVLFEESCLRKKYDSPHKQLGDGSHRDEIEGRLRNLEIRRLQLNQQRLSSPILRRLVYPLAMVLLLVLTTTALLNVVQNTLQLLVGIKSLPLSTSGQGTLGLTSLTKLGVVGALIEVALIGYLMAASTVGLYTLPFLRAIRPTARATPLTRLIVNCGLVLVLSSALPLLSRIALATLTHWAIMVAMSGWVTFILSCPTISFLLSLLESVWPRRSPIPYSLWLELWLFFHFIFSRYERVV